MEDTRDVNCCEREIPVAARSVALRVVSEKPVMDRRVARTAVNDKPVTFRTGFDPLLATESPVEALPEKSAPF